MRGLLVLAAAAALAACAQSEPATSTASQQITSLNVTTYSFGSEQVGMTTGAATFTVNEITDNHTDTISAVTYSCPDFTVTASLPGEADKICTTGCTQTELAPANAPGAGASHTGASGTTRAATSGGGTTAGAPPYVICPETLQCSADPYYFTAVFHPTVAATVSCVVTVVTSSSNLTLTLSGTGTPPPIHVTASPSSIGFGGVRVNTASSAVAVTISNSGGSTATVSSVGVTTGFAISAGPAAPFSVGAGGTQTESITCNPTAVGAISGTLKIVSNDPTTPTISIPLTCSGIDSNLAVSPSPAVLPTTRVGEPVQQTITITNEGGAATTIQDVTLTGMTMITAVPPNTPLAANASTTATIGFPATAAGSAAGNLHIDYDSGKSLDVTVSAVALSTSMSLTPDGNVDFGPVCAGQTVTQAFDIVANDQGPFQVTAIGTPDAPFALMMPPTLPAAVKGNAGNMVSFTVGASPTDAGSATSSIEVDTDIPNGMPNTINLAMTGLAAGVTATPPTVDVGPAELMMTTLAQPVYVSNCSDLAVTIADTKITGTDAASFAIVATPDGTQIAANATATWLVVMTATTGGTKNATFELDYDGGSATTALTGEALIDGSDIVMGTDKSSYYACSTGDAVPLWPVGAALALVWRRRRRSP